MFCFVFLETSSLYPWRKSFTWLLFRKQMASSLLPGEFTRRSENTVFSASYLYTSLLGTERPQGGPGAVPGGLPAAPRPCRASWWRGWGRGMRCGWSGPGAPLCAPLSPAPRAPRWWAGRMWTGSLYHFQILTFFHEFPSKPSHGSSRNIQVCPMKDH